MHRLATLALLALALSACQSPPPPEAPATAASAGIPTGADDTCGAAAHAALVGKDYQSVPAAPAGKIIRVVCSTCPMTMDYNAERINVIYDEKTGVIGKLNCG